MAMTYAQIWTALLALMPNESWCLTVECWHHALGGGGADIRPGWSVWVDRAGKHLRAATPEELLAQVRELPPKPAAACPPALAALGVCDPDAAHERNLEGRELDADAKGDRADEERGAAREDAS